MEGLDFYGYLRLPFDIGRIFPVSKPTQVTRGIANGFSLPIYAADNEELFACTSIPDDWNETDDFTLCVGGWLDTANDTKNFKLQLSWERWAAGDAVPNTSNDQTFQTATGTAAQYKFFFITETISASGFSIDDILAIRLYRIAADANEITGEFVVQGMKLRYVKSKIGGDIP